LGNIGKAYVEGWIDLEGDLATILSIADHLVEPQKHAKPSSRLLSYLKHFSWFDRRHMARRMWP